MTNNPPSGPDFEAQPQGWPAPQPGWQGPPGGPQQPYAPVSCAYHPGRAAGVRCQRCGNPICGECMIEAPVGFQCRACVARGMATTRQAEGPYGGRRSANPALTTQILIAINAAVWLGILLSGGFEGTLASVLALTPGGICQLDAQSWVGVSGASCLAAGGTFLPGPLDGGWWQLLTNAFAHAEPLHLGMNMLALWILGPQIERILGRARYLALYFVSALAASAFVMWLAEPITSTLGASGAISGLMGALLVIVVRMRGDVRWVLTWIGINVVITVLGSAGISWQGHLGGFLGGLAVTGVLVGLRKAGPRAQWIGVAALGVLTLLASVARVLAG